MIFFRLRGFSLHFTFRIEKGIGRELGIICLTTWETRILSFVIFGQPVRRVFLEPRGPVVYLRVFVTMPKKGISVEVIVER